MNRVGALVVAGPSGVGKSTLIRSALERRAEWTFSVSATTRQKRASEADGADYYFLDRGEFIRRIGGGEFLEYAEVYGNLYGTLKSEFDRAASEGKNLLIEIDSVGCLSIRGLRPEIPIVAVVPPTYSALRARLQVRGTEGDGDLELRLGNAWIELARMRMFDFVIVNDDLATAEAQFVTLLNLIEAGNNMVARTIDEVLATAGGPDAL